MGRVCVESRELILGFRSLWGLEHVGCRCVLYLGVCGGVRDLWHLVLCSV